MHPIPSLLARPKLYYNTDGVGELGLGFMCLGWSLLWWLQLHTPATAVWHQRYTFVIYVAVMLLIIHFGSQAIKNRITYRRTGFVEYRPRDKYWIPMVAGASVTALLASGLLLARRQQWDLSTMVTLVGLLLVAPYVRIASTVRWKWAVFGILLAGVLAISALPADVLEAVANHTRLGSAIPARVIGAYWLTFVVYGVALMVSGGVSFWQYLHRTQHPARDGQ